MMWVAVLHFRDRLRYAAAVGETRESTLAAAQKIFGGDVAFEMSRVDADYGKRLASNGLMDPLPAENFTPTREQVEAVAPFIQERMGVDVRDLPLAIFDTLPTWVCGEENAGRLEVRGVGFSAVEAEVNARLRVVADGGSKDALLLVLSLTLEECVALIFGRGTHVQRVS